MPWSATIAPPSARQFAPPTRFQLSSPLSPSISVTQPSPCRCAQADSTSPSPTSADIAMDACLFFTPVSLRAVRCGRSGALYAIAARTRALVADGPPRP